LETIAVRLTKIVSELLVEMREKESRMFQPYKFARTFRLRCTEILVALGVCILFSGIVAAQDLPAMPSRPELALPATTRAPLRVAFPLSTSLNGNNTASSANSLSANSSYAGMSLGSNTSVGQPEVRRLTLDEAQQLAAGPSNPLVRLAALQVRVAKEHRLGVQSMYFPNIGGQLENLHLNKNTGPVLTLDRLGLTVPVDIVGKNQTAFNFSAIQPVTPLFAVHQLVKIARSDETIARAKAGVPVAETASKVEANYFDLLIAERELVSAEAESKKIQVKWMSASSSGAPVISSQQETDMIGAEKGIMLATSKVKELTESLNSMLGLPGDTTLELVPPEPLVENTSMEEAVDTAAAANVEVVEAEQTAVKARAGSALSKMQYFPTVAIVGGYTNQNALNIILPKDFSYIGVIATYTVFDFGKRERGVKESNAQAEMAQMAVSLAKAKVTAEVRSSYFELDRARRLSQMARRMVSATQVVEASVQSDNSDVESAQAKIEADMLRAELDYRQAYARLKSLMGAK
jgi:outer membrane protein